jgi:uncharacterized protein (TIGR02284 family)
MSMISRLKELSELLTDSQQGFAEASERINDPYVKEVLISLGNGRAPLVEEIANELARSGEGTPDGGTMKGSLHRTWMSIRGSFSNSNAKEVIAECERGERYLLEQYDTVIEDDDIPGQIKPMLRKHRERVDAGLREIATMGKNIEEP